MTRYRQLASALGKPQAVLARWSDAFESSSLPLPGSVSAREIQPLVAGIVQELHHALPARRADGTVIPGELTRGSSSTRELEKAVAFAGASMAALGGSGFDLAAAVFALRDVAVAIEPPERAILTSVFEWLSVIALDAFAHAGAAAAVEKQRAQLEQGTPIVLLAPALPALFLVGAPDRSGLDAIFSRLLLTVARVGADVAIVDATGLTDPLDDPVLDSLTGFVDHDNVTGRINLIAVGLGREHERAWSRVCRAARVGFQLEQVFLSAVTRGLALSGYELVRARPS